MMFMGLEAPYVGQKQLKHAKQHLFLSQGLFRVVCCEESFASACGCFKLQSSSPESLRMVANSCGRLRSTRQRIANKTLTPDPPELNENPSLRIGEKGKGLSFNFKAYLAQNASLKDLLYKAQPGHRGGLRVRTQVHTLRQASCKIVQIAIVCAENF